MPQGGDHYRAIIESDPLIIVMSKDDIIRRSNDAQRIISEEIEANPDMHHQQLSFLVSEYQTAVAQNQIVDGENSLRTALAEVAGIHSSLIQSSSDALRLSHKIISKLSNTSSDNNSINNSNRK